MIAGLVRRLRRTVHAMRRRRAAPAGTVPRLVVGKAKWLGDAASPVVLMIDDLTNAWHNRQGGPSWEPGGDWGAGGYAQGSALQALETGLLREHPEARVTFFVVAGAISPYTRVPFSYAAPMDADEGSRAFFRKLHEDPRYELAYHGFNHGTPGDRTEQFLQEWRGFPSVAAAVEQGRRGLGMFECAIGARPLGGKYGGWDYNEHAEAAVNELGFLWWCRDWMPRDISGNVPSGYYEPSFFGEGPVIALPSTVHGHYWTRAQLDRLLRERQVISIEEHIAPVRPDGLVQTPNIIDDMPELRRIYQYLRDRNVWHANCSEIASYVAAREFSFIRDIDAGGFTIDYCGRYDRPLLTLLIGMPGESPRAAAPRLTVRAPDGSVTPPGDARYDPARRAHVVTVPVMSGRYHVDRQADRAG